MKSKPHRDPSMYVAYGPRGHYKSGSRGKFDMLLVRSQYLSHRKLHDHESSIVGKKEL